MKASTALKAMKARKATKALKATCGLLVKQPGVLSLLQDEGRVGHHRIGLTNGGPLLALGTVPGLLLSLGGLARTPRKFAFAGVALGCLGPA